MNFYEHTGVHERFKLSAAKWEKGIMLTSETIEKGEKGKYLHQVLAKNLATVTLANFTNNNENKQIKQTYLELKRKNHQDCDT